MPCRSGAGAQLARHRGASSRRVGAWVRWRSYIRWTERRLAKGTRGDSSGAEALTDLLPHSNVQANTRPRDRYAAPRVSPRPMCSPRPHLQLPLVRPARPLPHARARPTDVERLLSPAPRQNSSGRSRSTSKRSGSSRNSSCSRGPEKPRRSRRTTSLRSARTVRSTSPTGSTGTRLTPSRTGAKADEQLWT